MEKLFIFDSQSKKCKKPFGAIKCGECVMLSASALCTEVVSVKLVVFSEYDKKRDEYEMPWQGREGIYDAYGISLDGFKESGILWYWFALNTVDGKTLWFGKNGIVDNENNISSFQITVASCEYTTPSWFSEGVTYHVFVDRFYRASTSPELTEDAFFAVHKDKAELPYFKPNSKGVVENRDIYGGNLEGVIEKLPYLDSLGVKTIYLSPIFEAWSNHKYNTADYKKVDSHFGDEKILSGLCRAAKKYGMRVILDGVFSHTGSDSIYFNKERRYGENTGAWNDKNSPFRSWFDIDENGNYPSWWGIDTLPQVDELNRDYTDYIINGKDSVIAHWMRAGVSGWRLDVADELPDEFIEQLKARARKEDMEALVIGEVWEDASTKKAYGVSKKYFTDGVLDGVMNYPLKNCILDFLCGRISAKQAKGALMSIVENYPDISQRCLMNIIGTHDTVRATNELSVGNLAHKSKDFRATRVLDEKELALGKARLRQAAILQYMFPGSPCIYYGDEIGMQGFEDPFNRSFYTWDNVDEELLEFYRSLGKIKTGNKCMSTAPFSVDYAEGDFLAVSRGNVHAFVNRGEKCKMFKVSDELETVVVHGECLLSSGKLFLGSKSSCILSGNSSEN